MADEKPASGPDGPLSIEQLDDVTGGGTDFGPKIHIPPPPPATPSTTPGQPPPTSDRDFHE